MAALINVVLGVYFVRRKGRVQRWIQLTGSLFLGVGALLLIRAFMTEPETGIFVTTFTQWGMYLMLGGVILHVLSPIRD